MGHIDDNSGQRQASVDLNLVPFIDLMSVCIIFLLITAVWTQISMIQLGTSVYGLQADEAAEALPPAPHEQVIFQVDILPQGYNVAFDSKNWSVPVIVKGKYDHVAFLKLVQGFKKRYPKKVDVIVTSKNSMLYKDLIQAMDLLLKAGFSGISISTGEII